MDSIRTSYYFHLTFRIVIRSIGIQLNVLPPNVQYMPIMEWTPELGVNVKKLDDQHKKLIALINKLHDAMRAGQGKQVLEGTLQELAAYMVYHFETEENTQQFKMYPGYLEHKAEHAAFVKKVTDFQDEYAENRLSLTQDLMDFLRDWVNNHIMKTDKKYSTLFNEKGLA